MRDRNRISRIYANRRWQAALILTTVFIMTTFSPSLAAAPKWGIPKSCEIPEMLEFHPNYIMREQKEQSHSKLKSCVMNTPAVLGDEPRYVEYEYRESKLAFKKFMNAELKRFSITNPGKLEVSTVTVKKTKCDIFVVYQESNYAWDLYWKYIKCGNGVTRIYGYEFDKNNYKNDTFALLIAGHMKK